MTKREMQNAIIEFWQTTEDDVLISMDPDVLKLIEDMGDYLEVTTSE